MLTAAMQRLLDALPARALPSALRRDGEGRRVAVGTVALFVVQVFGTAISLALQVVLARAIGNSSYGLYLYVLGWMNVASLFGRMDLDIVATRYVSAYHAQEDWPRLHGLLRRVRQTVTGASIVLGVTAALCIYLSRGRMSAETMRTALLATVLLPATTLLLVSAATLQGLKHGVEAQAPSLVLRPLLFLGIVGAIVLAGGMRPDASTAVAANVVATMTALALTLWFLRRRVPEAARHAPPAFEMNEWMRAGLWFVGIDVFQLALSQQSDVLVVGTLLSTADAAHYGAASQLATLVHFGATAVVFMTAPLISGLYTKQTPGALQRVVSTAALANLSLALPLLLVMVVAGRWLLGWYGAGFDVAYPVLLVLACSQFVSAIVGNMAGTIMSMTGRQAAAAVMIGVSAVLNLALAIPLTRGYGLIGTAIATLTATAFRSVMLTLYLRKHLGLRLLPSLRRP